MTFLEVYYQGTLVVGAINENLVTAVLQGKTDHTVVVETKGREYLVKGTVKDVVKKLSKEGN